MEFLEHYKKNKPSHLEAHLRENKCNIVGLEYVVELENAERKERRYLCTLCELKNPLDLATIKHHLESNKHIEKYLERDFNCLWSTLISTPYYQTDITFKSRVLRKTSRVIFDHFGMLSPTVCLEEFYNRRKDEISKAIKKSPHFSLEDLEFKAKSDVLIREIERNVFSPLDDEKVNTLPRKSNPNQREREDKRRAEQAKINEANLARGILSKNQNLGLKEKIAKFMTEREEKDPSFRDSISSMDTIIYTPSDDEKNCKMLCFLLMPISGRFFPKYDDAIYTYFLRTTEDPDANEKLLKDEVFIRIMMEVRNNLKQIQKDQEEEEASTACKGTSIEKIIDLINELFGHEGRMELDAGPSSYNDEKLHRKIAFSEAACTSGSLSSEAKPTVNPKKSHSSSARNFNQPSKPAHDFAGIPDINQIEKMVENNFRREKFDVCVQLSGQISKNTPKWEKLDLAKRYITKNFRRCCEIYTDASKSRTNTSFAVYCGSKEYTEQKKLLNFSSVDSAELLGVQAGLGVAKSLSIRNPVIFTDSERSCRKILKDSKEPEVNETIHNILKLMNETKAKVAYVPAHCGLDGNEKADDLAYKALSVGQEVKNKILIGDFDGLEARLRRNKKDRGKCEKFKEIKKTLSIRQPRLDRHGKAMDLAF